MMKHMKFLVLMALGSICLAYPVLGYSHFPDMMPLPQQEQELKRFNDEQDRKSAEKVEKYHRDKEAGKKAKEPSKKEKKEARRHDKNHGVNNKTRKR